MTSRGRSTVLLVALSLAVVACGDNEVTIEHDGQGTRTPTPAVTSTQTPTAIPTATQGEQTPTQAPTPTITPTPEELCGNGIVDGVDEECDGDDLDELTCFDLCFDQDEEGGTLSCNPDCTFNFSQCVGTDCEP